MREDYDGQAGAACVRAACQGRRCEEGDVTWSAEVKTPMLMVAATAPPKSR